MFYCSGLGTAICGRISDMTCRKLENSFVVVLQTKLITVLNILTNLLFERLFVRCEMHSFHHFPQRSDQLQQFVFV